MITLFEGLDNTGKSTQIQNLIEHYKDRIFHKIHYSAVKTLSSDEAETYSKKLYTDMFKIISECNKDRNIVFDRAHLGEYVYGKIYRNYDANWTFDLEVDKDTTFLIVLVDEPKNVLYREDGLSLSKSDNIEESIRKISYEKQRFEEAYNKSTLTNKILINIDGLDIEQVKDIIINFIEGK